MSLLSPPPLSSAVMQASPPHSPKRPLGPSRFSSLSPLSPPVVYPGSRSSPLSPTSTCMPSLQFSSAPSASFHMPNSTTSTQFASHSGGTGSTSPTSNASRLQLHIVADTPIFPANVNLDAFTLSLDNHSSPHRSKMIDKHMTPPRSPSGGSFHSSPGVRRRDWGPKKSRFAAIGQFYFPDGVPLLPDTQLKKRDLIANVFRAHGDHGGIRAVDFHAATRAVCDLPSYCSAALFLKLQPLCPHAVGIVTHDAFMQFWTAELEKVDSVTRFFRILKQPDQNFLTRNDFVPLLQEVVDGHPGLEFLEETPEFQQRYMQTVIARIFYVINKSGNERLTLGELRKSNFMDVLSLLDEEDDINKIHDYFSYEHFYVLYVKFWELDSDHDFLLSRENLLSYGDYALTTRVVDRIMTQVPRRFRSNVEGTMGFEDFIVFMISEEDKGSEVAKEYWFRIFDLDGDGRLERHELEYFFSEQQQRMQHLAHESILFEDIYCQLLDMIKPENPEAIVRHDLRRCRLVPFFCNILVNLTKFIRHEQRDALAVEREKAYPHLSDWDRFAIGAYYLLSGEEEHPDTIRQEDGVSPFSVEQAELAMGSEWKHVQSDQLSPMLQIHHPQPAQGTTTQSNEFASGSSVLQALQLSNHETGLEQFAELQLRGGL